MILYIILYNIIYYTLSQESLLTLFTVTVVKMKIIFVMFRFFYFVQKEITKSFYNIYVCFFTGKYAVNYRKY